MSRLLAVLVSSLAKENAEFKMLLEMAVMDVPQSEKDWLVPRDLLRKLGF